jgi:uncharacterized membrane protein YhaH (DUF805 family)
MDYVWYLFRFEGRINRAKNWQAILILIAISICWIMVFGVLTFVTASLLGVSGPLSFSLGTDEILKLFEPAFYRTLTLAKLPAVLFQVTGSILILWIFLATSIKRLHDRDKSAWWLIPFFVFPGYYDKVAEWLPEIFILQALLGLGTFVLCVWGMIELYFLKGTPGTNRFGADPLAPVDTRPAWDQQSEVEMVPRKASPPPVWRVKPGYE